MTTASNLQKSVSLPRAIEIATARVEAYAAARKALGASPSEAFLLDAQRAWDSALGVLGSIQADARYEESVGGAVVDGLRGKWLAMARECGPDTAGRESGCYEVFAMLAVEWPDLANEIVQYSQVKGLR